MSETVPQITNPQTDFLNIKAALIIIIIINYV